MGNREKKLFLRPRLFTQKVVRINKYTRAGTDKNILQKAERFLRNVLSLESSKIFNISKIK